MSFYRSLAIATDAVGTLPAWGRVAARSLFPPSEGGCRLHASAETRVDDQGRTYLCWDLGAWTPLPHAGPARLLAGRALVATGDDLRQVASWGSIDSGLPADSQAEQDQWQRVADAITTDARAVAYLSGFAVDPPDWEATVAAADETTDLGKLWRDWHQTRIMEAANSTGAGWTYPMVRFDIWELSPIPGPEPT